MKTSNSESDLKPIGEFNLDWIKNLPKLTPEEEAKREAEEKRRLQDEHDWEAAMLLGNATIPSRHNSTKAVFAGPWRDAWQRVRGLLGSGSIIPIIGTRGSGKTQLAVTAIQYFTDQLKSAKYTKAMGVFLEIREGMKSNITTEREAIRRFVEPKLLVIDAMEVRGETDFENRVLDYLIDLRYDAGFDTILISNQKREEFGKSLGLSIISRVHESGDIIECNWESFREAPKPE